MAGPIVNINTAGAKGLVSLSTADSTTGWGGFKISGGATPSAVLEQDVFIQGTAAVSTKLSGAGTDKGLWYDNSSGVDMTVAGRHLYIWVAVTTVAATDTIANNGIYIMCSTAGGGTPTEYIAFNVGGSDFTVDAGFVRYVVDLNKTPSRSAGSTNLSSIRYFGAGITMTGTSKSENLIIDRVDYGDGLQIERGQNGNAANFEQLFVADNTNKYGIITKTEGIYYLNGGLTIGDPTDGSGFETYWDDFGNRNVQFADPKYHNGITIVSSIDSDNLYEVECLGNNANSTRIIWGDVVGTGDNRRGLNGGRIGSAGPKWKFDAETDIAQLNQVSVYGLTMQGAGVTRFTGSTKTDIIGCSFIECDEIQPNDAEFLNNAVIAPTPDRGLEIVNPNQIKNIDNISAPSDEVFADFAWQVDESTAPDTFVDVTTDFNDAGASDCAPFPSSEAVNDYFVIGRKDKFQRCRINTGTAGAGGTPAVVWEYPDSASTWAALEDVSDGTNSFTTTGLQPVEWKVPADWVSRSLQGENPLYYVRARLTSVYTTTNPLITQGVLARQVEHAVHFPAAGTFSFNGMKFFTAALSTLKHTENSAAATVTDNYPDSNQDAVEGFGGGSHASEALGQGITGDGNVLSRAVFQLRTNGSPTGACFARLYAHTGAFGSTGTPTGAALAQSKNVDVASLITSALRLIEFEFEDEFTLVNTTNYFITVHYSGGSSSNFLEAGKDTSSPSHGGNKATQATGGGWTAASGEDLVFAVHTGAIVTVNATDSDPSVDDHTSTTANGATIIVNTVNITVHVEDSDGNNLQNVRVGVYTDDVAQTELMNEDTDSGGDATEAFAYSSDQPITIRVRESPNQASGRYIPFFTRGTITSAGFAIDVILDEDNIASVT